MSNPPLFYVIETSPLGNRTCLWWWEQSKDGFLRGILRSKPWCMKHFSALRPGIIVLGFWASTGRQMPPVFSKKAYFGLGRISCFWLENQ